MQDRSKAGRTFRKLSDQDMLDIRLMYTSGRYSETQLSVKFNVSISTIHRVLVGGNYMPTVDGCQESIDVQLKQGASRIRAGRKYHLTEDQVKHMRVLYATGKYTVGQLADHNGISDRQVHTILRGEQWRDVGGPLVPATHGHLGQANAQAKLDEVKVRVIRSMAANGMSQYAIAKDIQVSQAAVSKVLTGRTWTHVI
jgi:DNA-binding MarR family transcriptional regulator